MSHTLILNLPFEIYEPLLKSAAQAQQSPEEWVMRWLKQAVLPEDDDPLEKYAGFLKSNFPNWSDRHDQLLGEALAQQLGNNGDGN